MQARHRLSAAKSYHILNNPKYLVGSVADRKHGLLTLDLSGFVSIIRFASLRAGLNCFSFSYAAARWSKAMSKR